MQTSTRAPALAGLPASNPNGDGFLAVRGGPDAGYAKLDELYNGDVVTICDEKGSWFGDRLMARTAAPAAPVPRPMAYNGPCRAGWVFGRYVGLHRRLTRR